jgi:glutamyl-tRNA synthetase
MAVLEERPSIRVRFPPSPTGHFHLGSARTALFNWFFARHHKGQFVLRIEDTDTERSEQKYEIELIESLKWLGLNWDEGPDWQLVNRKWQTSSRGDFGPYRQSERTHIYKKYLEKLLDEKKAYYCYCAKEELEAERQAMIIEGLPPKYSGHCRNLAKPPALKTPQLIRFKTSETQVEFRDLIRGRVVFDAGLFGDIVIARNLESPLYNFSVVVDDYEMKITHVIRGEEHLSNTPKQILLERALGFPEPLYAHLPLILAPDRSKLSKRFSEAHFLQYREQGYLPEAMINFLALLGWHPAGDQEIFSIDELIEKFNLKRAQKAGAVFNREKLDWLNGEYLKKLSAAEIAERLKPFLKTKKISVSQKFLKKVVMVERERMKTLGDFLRLGGFFFELPDYQPHLLTWKNNPSSKIKEVLEKAAENLNNLPVKNFARDKLAFALSELIDENDRGTVLWPLRVAVSGQAASPDPLEIIEILGKEETVRRIKIAINKIGLAL